MQGWAEQSG